MSCQPISSTMKRIMLGRSVWVCPACANAVEGNIRAVTAMKRLPGGVGCRGFIAFVLMIQTTKIYLINQGWPYLEVIRDDFGSNMYDNRT